jgi:23S rRNA pseudouridine2605 synthase
MRDRPSPHHRLEWPGGVVPEWARAPQGNKRRGKGPGGGGGGASKRERLQKVMAQSGHGSRRNIEILIAQGHVTINGQVAKLGDSVGPGDKVKLDGRLIRLRFGESLPRVLLYHKQTGEIVTRDDPEKRPTVFDRLPKVQGGRWVSVGRLDFNTEGLLIFTTDGELANRLMHPRFEVEREYAVRLLGELTEEHKAKLLEGIDIEGEPCKFDSIEDRGGEGANHWYHVVLREGKNREVRGMMEALGLTVSRLLRVRYGPVEMPGFLKRGMMREMQEEDVQNLLAFAGMQEVQPQAEDHEEEHPDDNIGNRVSDTRERAPRAEPHDDYGNRAVPEDAGNRIADDVGNRGAPPPRPQGQQQRPQQQQQPRNARRPHGPKPFFGKKRGGGGRGPQGQQQHDRQKDGNVAQGGAPQGGGQPQGQGQGGWTPPPEGGQRPPGQGFGKPGRNRRHKNRNRNRNAAQGNAAQSNAAQGGGAGNAGGGGGGGAEQQPRDNRNRENF